MPYPPKDGGAIATFSHIKAFAKFGHQLTVLAMNTSKHYFSTNHLPDEVKKMAYFHAVDVDNKIKPFDAFLNLFTGKSYNVKRFISGEFETILIKILKHKTFDIIQLEGLYLSPYVEIIRKHSKALIVMRSHNIEHQIWERIVKLKTFGFKKIYLKILAKRLKKYEMSMLNKYDLLVPISDIDAKRFKELGCNIPVYTSPAGIDSSDLQPSSTSLETPSIFYIGGLDWMPNQEGILWFLKNVWDKLHDKYPKLRFYIAGRNTPQKIINLHYPNVEILGEIDDAYAFINSKSIMVVPLFSGSGMRIKIIEAMALEKVVISTPVGAEGINYTNKKNILIATTPEDFITSISDCIENKNMADNIGKNARNFVNINYNNNTLVSSLLKYYQDKIILS